MGERRGADRRCGACRSGRRATHPVPRGRVPDTAPPHRGPAAHRSAEAVVRIARRVWSAGRRLGAFDRRARLGSGDDRARGALRRRAAAARGRTLPAAPGPHRRDWRAPLPLARQCARVRRLPGRRGTRRAAARGPLDGGGDRRADRKGRNMSSRTCPDWPKLMEYAPDLQFKHYTVAEAKLPGEALMKIPEISLDDVAICCDLERHVFYAAHTDPKVGEALRATHWFEVAEWTSSGPGSAASNL